MLPLFQTVAQEMMDEMGPLKALCAALAVISGQTTPLPERSMITSIEGFKTFVLRVAAGLAETRQVALGLPSCLPSRFQRGDGMG